MCEKSLVKELNTSIDLLGVDGTIDVLKRAREEQFNNLNVSFVMENVIGLMKITKEELQKINSRNDSRKVAIGFCVFLLNTYFSYSHEKISKFLPFELDRRTIANYHDIIRSAKLKNPVSDIDKLITYHYDSLIESITNYKNKQHGG